MPRTMTEEAVDAEFAPMPTNNVPATNGPPPFEPTMNHAPTPVSGFRNIATAMSAVMSEIGVIGEGGENKFQNYKYMSYKDLYRKLTPLMGRHGLSIIPTELRIDVSEDRAIVRATYQFTILHSSGEVWPAQPVWTGISRAKDSKGGWDDKALNKCATAAQKYFLKALFQIPSGEDDEDADHHDGNVDRAPRAPRVPSPSKAADPAPAAPKLATDKPHAIPTDGMKLKGWADLYMAAIKGAESLGAILEWKELNQGAIETIADRLPEVSNAIDALHLERAAAFKPKDDPISSGTKKIATKPPKAEKARPAGISPLDDLDGFMMHHLSAMIEIKDGGELESYFNTNITPWQDDLFPSDHADLLSSYEKAQARLKTEE